MDSSVLFFLGEIKPLCWRLDLLISNKLIYKISIIIYHEANKKGFMIPKDH